MASSAPWLSQLNRSIRIDINFKNCECKHDVQLEKKNGWEVFGRFCA